MKLVQKLNKQLQQAMIKSYRGLQEDALVLKEIRVEHCRKADHDHYKDERVYAHTRHKDGVICVSSSLELLDDANILGVLAHEYGHIIHEEMPDLISGAEEWPGELEFEIDLEYEVQFVGGVEVDHEIFADWIVEKSFGMRIWYDHRKIQWLHLGG